MKKIHFMGIGGSGMNAAAGIAHSLGYEVTGCDIKESEYTADLVRHNIPIMYGHSIDHISSQDILCVSPAVQDLNPYHEEIVYAKANSISVLTWQEFMGKELQVGKKVVAVAGTKGKTTTTALIGLLLESSGMDPTVAVGGIVAEWDRNYRVGESGYFVCEADEFNNNFLHFSPQIIVLTNLEFDHPEFFNSYEEYLNAYFQFVSNMQADGVLIANIDSQGVVDLLTRLDHSKIKILTYGAAAQADYRLQHYVVENGSAVFQESHQSEVVSYRSALIGEYNAHNALGMIVLADVLKIEQHRVSTLLREYKGVARRFELVCSKNQIAIYNDYAHNPMSVRAVLRSARELYPDHRIWAVFQPHLFSRTKIFLDEFALSFGDSDLVLISDIYASREKGKPVADEIHSKDLVARIHALNPSINARYSGTTTETIELLLREIGESDVVVNMGAGDNGIISESLCQKIQ